MQVYMKPDSKLPNFSVTCKQQSAKYTNNKKSTIFQKILKRFS